jgi:cysteine desulfurase
LALYSAIAQGTRRLIIGATEHPSLVEAAQASGLPVESLPVDGRGVSDLDWLRQRLKAWSAEDGRPFVALMMANNETGVIQPVAEAAEIVHAAGGWLHVDAVQAAGKIAIDMAALGADTLVISAHKLGGPQGSGALIVRPGVDVARRNFGGGQERGRRGGTENVPGIAGFGAAAKATLGQPDPTWRDEAAERLRQHASIVVIGEGAPRLPNTLCIAAEGFSSDLQVMGLDLAGVMVSAGSACSSGKVKASPVIAAMGLSDLAGSAIRVSGGWATTREDWIRFADAWLDAHARHVARAPKLVEA